MLPDIPDLSPDWLFRYCWHALFFLEYVHGRGEAGKIKLEVCLMCM